MITLIIFLLILGLIVFIHEFGHFIMAKKAGIHVFEFSLGFGPKLFSFKSPTCPATPTSTLIDNLSAIIFKSATASEDIVPTAFKGCPITEKPRFLIFMLLLFISTSALILLTETL